MIVTEEIGRALELWIEITGVDPEAKRFNLGEWDIRQISESLQKSMELDTTLLTTLMMMNFHVRKYIRQRSFSVESIMEDFSTVSNYLEKTRELLAILNTEEIQEYAGNFRDTVVSGLEHYSVDSEKTLGFASDTDCLAFVRRDALNSMETLQEYQFFQGDPDPSTPVFADRVYEFWNVNSLVKAMVGHPSGISLNLIRDPDGYNSFFCFGVRNGGTLTILSDRPEWSHPMQGRMSRLPARDLGRRIMKHWFPYELLEYEFNAKGDLYIRKKETAELVPYQKEAHPMKPINELEPACVVWIYMMMDLIQKKYFIDNYKAPELTYTAEMIVHQDALVNEYSKALVPIKGYEPIVVDDFTLASVDEDEIFDQWEERTSGQNQWMVDRYAPDMPEEYLNLMDNPDRDTIYIDHEDLSKLKREAPQEFKNNHFMNRYKNPQTLAAFDATNFGTKTDLLKDRAWFARYNLAKYVKAAAKKEFEERKDEVYKWVKDKIWENFPNLQGAIAWAAFMAPGLEHRGFGFQYRHANICTIFGHKPENWYAGIRFTGSWDKNWYTSCISDQKSSIVALFEPTSAAALAMLCGCKVKDLPEVLQHWEAEEQYVGNSILDRVDPLDWACENPWRKGPYRRIWFHFTKREFNRFCKDHKSPYDGFYRDLEVEKQVIRRPAHEILELTVEEWRSSAGYEEEEETTED